MLNIIMMKLLDMYFWQIGMKNEGEEKSDTYNEINNDKDVGKNEGTKDKSVWNMVVEAGWLIVSFQELNYWVISMKNILL